jgi:LacI family transcriptional regulator
VILAPAPDPHMSTVAYLKTARVPAVLVDRFMPADIDQVGTENEQSTATLVKHLAELGHTRIAIVAGLHGLSTTEERVRGYRAGLLESGLPVDNALVSSAHIPYAPADDAVDRLLSGNNPATALVVGSNSMTIRVLHALRERGLSVPRDIALAAFDDFEWSDLFQPRLTVIAQPTRDIGAKAVELLLSRLDDPNREPQSLRLPATFVHRESCGCRLNRTRDDEQDIREQ